MTSSDKTFTFNKAFMVFIYGIINVRMRKIILIGNFDSKIIASNSYFLIWNFNRALFYHLESLCKFNLHIPKISWHFQKPKFTRDQLHSLIMTSSDKTFSLNKATANHLIRYTDYCRRQHGIFKFHVHQSNMTVSISCEDIAGDN